VQLSRWAQLTHSPSYFTLSSCWEVSLDGSAGALTVVPNMASKLGAGLASNSSQKYLGSFQFLLYAQVEAWMQVAHNPVYCVELSFGVVSTFLATDILYMAISSIAWLPCPFFKPKFSPFCLIAEVISKGCANLKRCHKGFRRRVFSGDNKALKYTYVYILLLHASKVVSYMRSGIKSHRRFFVGAKLGKNAPVGNNSPVLRRVLKIYS